MPMPPELQAWVDDYEAHDPFSWIVEVDPEEAEHIAQWRHRATQGLNKHRFLDQLEADRIGAFGELATSKRFGLDKPQLLESGGDGGIDFRVRFPADNVQGWREVTMDVKTREDMPTRYLMCPPDRIFKGSADWFVLCQKLDARRVRLVGWDGKSFVQLEPLRDFGKGPTHPRPLHQLRPMHQLEYLLNLRIAA
jgi:hypothetical protein